MRTIEISLYKFSELSESAKESACAEYRANMEFVWCEESEESLQAFCRKFEIKFYNNGICAHGNSHWKLSEYDNSNFRKMKLKDFEREDYPTGYCLDATMSIEFYDEFKRTGDAMHAFYMAIQAGVSAFEKDLEHQLSDEYIGELLEVNEYEFDEDGHMN